MAYKARVMMEEVDDESSGGKRYQITTASGEKAGHVSKDGANFSLYDSHGVLLKSIRGRLIETKEAVSSDVAEEEGLTLLCKVCGGRVPIDLVEKHAKICAISFPVQILRFAHSVVRKTFFFLSFFFQSILFQEAEQPAPEKKRVKKDGEEISCLEDFPQTVLTALDKSGVPRELYAKHLPVLVNVLNFASKMKFYLAEDRPSPVRDAAKQALKHKMNPNDLQELCKVLIFFECLCCNFIGSTQVLHSNGSGRSELQLAQQALSVLEDGLAIMSGAPPRQQPEKRISAEAEGQRILAAQKEVMNQVLRREKDGSTVFAD